MADTLESTTTDGVHGMVVVNPDGTSIGSSVASGSPDSGNSVKIGGVYNLIPPTLDSGDRGDVQLDANGNVKISLANALSNVIDKITSYMATDSIMSGVTALTPKFAVIDHATSGDNTIVAAVTAKKIRVIGGLLVASAAVTARFESGAGGTALTGQMQLAANGGFIIPYMPTGNFETASGSLLNLELSGAISVDGWITYVEV